MTIESPIKWRAILSLVLILISTIMNWWWLWGGMLIFWGVTNLLEKQTWLSETIQKSENPVLFYLVVMTWLFFWTLLYCDTRFVLNTVGL